MEIRKTALEEKDREVRAQSVGLQMPEGYMPYVGNWRNIKSRNIQRFFEAFIHAGKDFSMEEYAFQ